MAVLGGALVYANYNMSRGKDNALGWALLQSRGYMGDPISIIGHFVDTGVIEYEGLLVLQDDIHQYLRIVRIITSLDQRHDAHWREIEETTFLLLDFTGEFKHLIEEEGGITGGGNLTIHGAEISALREVKNELDSIYANLYSSEIVVGAHPKVVIRDSAMTSAVETALELRARLSSMDEVFDIERIL
jgi:hypothetical protein